MTEVQAWIQLAFSFCAIVVSIIAILKSNKTNKNLNALQANPLIQLLLSQGGGGGGGGGGG